MTKQKLVQNLATWTVIYLPALTMWVPIGAEAWLLITLLVMGSLWISGWRPEGVVWGHEQKRIAYALLILITTKLVSLLWSVSPDQTWQNIKLHFHLLLYIPLVIIFSQISDHKNLFFNKALPTAVIPGVIWAFIEWQKSNFSLNGIEFEGAAKNSLILAIFLTYIVSNLIFETLSKVKWTSIVLIAFSTIILITNGKRSTIVAILITAIAGWIIYTKQKSHSPDLPNTNPKQHIPIIFLSFSLVILLTFLTWDKWLLAWKESTQFFVSGFAGGSVDARWQLYSVAIQAFLSNPLIGSGAGTTRFIVEHSMPPSVLLEYNHYHQIFLQLLADLGLVGLLIWVGCLWHIQVQINKTVEFYPTSFRLTGYTIILVMVLFGSMNLSFGNILVHIFFVYLLALVSARKSSITLDPKP